MVAAGRLAVDVVVSGRTVWVSASWTTSSNKVEPMPNIAIHPSRESGVLQMDQLLVAAG